MPNQGVGPYHVTDADPYVLNDIFRQIEEQINRLQGLGVSVSIQIGVHTHQTTATGGKLDHGAALTGLGDNDHPQYLLASAVTTDEALEQAVDSDHISDQVMVDATLTLAEQADASGDAIKLALADTAVTPGTYGDATNVSQITVDQQGRLTAAANVAIVVTATEANDVAFVEASQVGQRITDEVVVGEDLALIEQGEVAGDVVLLDVATAQTLEEGENRATSGFETVVDGLAELQNSIDSTGRLHFQGQNRFLYLQSMAIARQAAGSDQSITNSTWTVITWDAETIDTDALHDTVTNNSRITVAITGKYLVGGVMNFASNGTGLRAFQLLKNNAGAAYDGTKVVCAVSASAVTGISYTNSISNLVPLTAGDYIEAYVFQSSGGNLNFGTEAGAFVGLPNMFAIYVGE